MPYTLWFFTDENPEDTPEYVREGEFDSVEDAEERIENIGSRWFFYPHALISDSEGSEVATYYAEP
jgi:hypothetical protein